MNFERMLARWNALSMRRRRLLCAVALALAACAALVALCARDTRVALFPSALKPDQIAEIDAQLAAWNVTFAPGPDGIRVEARRRGELVARLAAAGVPHAHVVGTSEAMASVGSLTPQTVMDAQARTGLEGDIEKGLRGIGGIGDARVIYAPARAGVFADEPSSEASASVRVTAAGGMTVAASTVASVKSFVAAGIPGLRPERVTVVDDRGGTGDEFDRDATQRERSLQSALDAAFGSDAAIVRVHVERDERVRESHETHRVPLGVPIVRTRSDERLHAEKKTYAKTETSEDRGSDVREERTTVPSGTLARLSVAVIVDSGRGLDLAKIREVAAAASGIDRGRGDTLTIESVPFDRPRAHGVPVRALASILAGALPFVALAAVAIAAVRVGARPLGLVANELVRHLRSGRTVREAAGLTPQAIYDALRGEPAYAAAAVIATLGIPAAAAVLDLYPQDERAAIVARLGRRRSPLVPSVESLIGG